MKTFSNELSNKITTLRNSGSFINYLDSRKKILTMMDRDTLFSPSDYWNEELEGFAYMFDASPLIIDKLREHCYHITGIKSYEYRHHHERNKPPFIKKLEMLKILDKNGLFVSENTELGGFGFDINNNIINLDTLKFYESMIALNMSGILSNFSSGKMKKIVIEIGAGWGGFAYQFKKRFPNTCYVLVDLPPTMLFSAVYLQTVFPEAKCLFFGDVPDESLINRCNQYDFVFLPHYFFDKISQLDIALTINMVSFQEMTTSQVEGYVKKLASLKCPNIYSHNRNCSPNNNQLTSVHSIIEKYYTVFEQHVLDYQYTDFSFSKKTSVIRSFRKYLSNLLRPFISKEKESIHAYRHLIGKLI